MRSAVLLFLFAAGVWGQQQDWVQRSNENTKILIQLDAKYGPEDAASEGLPGFDDEISSFSADRSRELRADTATARDELKRRFDAEKDPLVRQDLQILIKAADDQIRTIDAEDKIFIGYRNVLGLIFFGEKSLLDEQVKPERHPAAVARLRRYTGMEAGYTPITEQVMALLRERMKNPALLGPAKEQAQKDLQNADTYVNGIGLLLEKYNQKGYQEALAKLRAQVGEYNAFVRKEILPRSRDDFRLPPAIYLSRLENYGVDYTPAELTRLAHAAFTQMQQQMSEIAARVAKERHLASSDYRDVIRELKKEQFEGPDILPKYQATLKQIEEIIRQNHLLTLPERPAHISIATAAETAQQPAPHMKPPPLLNNHGEHGTFVLPLETKGEGGAALKYDDFTFAAATWTLTAHEARPGHELQFDSMVERGVSQARALYAFNSTNVEGWGLYSEWFMLPYMPDEAKLVSLDYRLLRAARAFLDPELQAGRLTPAQAMAVLENDVMCSKGFATEEVERYTFRSPGQAVSYFDGYTRLLEIRQAAEKALGSKFNVQKFHDFILSQGLLPPDLLRKAVMQDFVANQ